MLSNNCHSRDLWKSPVRGGVLLSGIQSLIFLLVLSINAYAETIHYSISQMGIKAGEASLSLKGEVNYKNEQLVLIEFRADGFNFFDNEMIYVDPKEYRPRFVERDLNIFGKKEKIVEEYQHDKIIVTKTVGGVVSVQELKKQEKVDNIYGFIFRYRRDGAFKVGEELEMNLPTTNLKIKVLKQVPLKAAGKTFDSLYMQSDPAKYKLWFDASGERLPLRISGAAGVGNTVMLMTSYEK